jgi:predicted solute-binding protein
MGRLIRLGVGDWPSALPFAWPLQQRLLSLSGELVVADAADIDERMAEGMLTAGLVSPAEYLRHADRYRRSAHLGLMATGPGAQAAILFSRHALSLLEGATFAVQPAAGGERALLEALLRAEHALVVETEERRGPLALVLRDFPAVLLVGERALLTAQNLPAEVSAHDLTDWWHQATGLPYPVGVWVAQRQWAEDHPEAWQQVQREVAQARDLGLLMQEAMLADWCERRPIRPEAMSRHLGAYSYEPGGRFGAAMTRFAQLAGLPLPPGDDHVDR